MIYKVVAKENTSHKVTQMTELHTKSMQVIVEGTLASCSSSLDSPILKILEPIAAAISPTALNYIHNMIKHAMMMMNWRRGWGNQAEVYPTVATVIN